MSLPLTVRYQIKQIDRMFMRVLKSIEENSKDGFMYPEIYSDITIDNKKYSIGGKIHNDELKIILFILTTIHNYDYQILLKRQSILDIMSENLSDSEQKILNEILPSYDDTNLWMEILYQVLSKNKSESESSTSFINNVFYNLQDEGKIDIYKYIKYFRLSFENNFLF